MNKFILRGLFAFGMAIVFSLLLPSQAMAAGNCGGEGQKSCWNINPAKWCDPGLKYETKGLPGSGRCVLPDIKKTTKSDCGGLNQKSCWNINPAKWCDEGLQYQTKGLPGTGRCVRKVNEDLVKQAAAQVSDRAKSIGPNNPLSNLMNCLHSPANFGRLRAAMNARSENGVNSLIGSCGGNREGLRAFGQSTTGQSSNTLHIELGGTAVLIGGVEGAIGYALELKSHPKGRFYLTGGLGGGPGGENASADLSVGVSGDSLPTGKWAKDQGKSVDYSGHYIGGAGLSIEFPGGAAVKPNGITISGGGGFGVEINTIFYSWDLYPF